MIHVLNNLPKDYDVILNEIENRFTVTRDNALAINVICKKLNHQYKNIKNKKRRKSKLKRP